MVKPIHLLLSPERETESTIPNRILNKCRFLLPGAERLLHQTTHGYVLEQWYDTPDAFVQLINVSVQQRFKLPFITTRYDLYAFHTLAGTSFLIEPNHAEPYGSGIKSDLWHFRLSYLPPASYHAQFEGGDYLIFFFVIKPSLLFREYSPELHDSMVSPVKALQQQLCSMQVSPARRIPQTTLQRIIHFLRDPGETYLKRLESIQTTLIFLLRQYLDDLHLLHLREQSETEIIEQAKSHIKSSIAEGDHVTLEQLANQCGLSLAYLKSLFVKHQKIRITHYIVEEKLKLSRNLLKSGIPVLQVATYLCWDPSHFRRIFKLHHRITPKAFQQQFGKDQK